MVTIRHERSSDATAREMLLDQAFGEARHAKTSERLREGRLPADGLAFAACQRSRLIGTVRLWNVMAGPGRPALLLGPVAVAADCRNRGVGAALMHHALDAARTRGHATVLLVGDAAYYGRFGFSNRSTAALWLPGPYQRERFLGCELSPDALANAHGLVSPAGRPEPKPDLAALVAGLVEIAPASMRRAA